MTKFRILSIAAQDLASAMEYYETKSVGLGGDFLDEYENTKGPFQGFTSFQRLGRLSAPTSEDVLCAVFLMPYSIPGWVKSSL